MISILISLLILLVIFAVIWWIFTLIPIPAPFAWIVQIVLAILFLIALISLLTGNFALYNPHPLLR